MATKTDIDQITNLSKVKHVKLENGNDFRWIHEDDRVYVTLPEGTISKKADTQPFLMAYVLEIRGGPFWFKLRFYKGWREHTDNEWNLSPTELIPSEQVEWVPSYRIIDSMGPYFKEFDDSLAAPARMNSKIWFHRSSKVLCKSCQEPYAPHQDRQRYCDTCKSWYHVRCLQDLATDGDLVDFDLTANQPIDTESREDNGLPQIFYAVLAGPNVRGHGGVYNWENNWLVTGSGVQKGMIAEWMEEGECPETWLELLGEGFLEDFLVGKSWKFYSCPTCAINI